MKCLYEFIGTFFLVLTIGMCVLTPGSAENLAPLAIGSVLAVMVYAGGHISGGHYNPAVSFSVFLRGKLPLAEMVKYWITQIVAAVVASWLVVYLKGSPAVAPMQIDTLKCFIAEFLFTFALCFVVLNVAVDRHTANNSYFGLAIGFTVLAGAFAVGSISGAAFNPAVAVGVCLMNLSSFANLWVYLVATLLGAAAATLAFNAAHCSEQDR